MNQKISRSLAKPAGKKATSVYFEVQLDDELHEELVKVAKEHNITPFEACVVLLREAVDARK